MTDQFWIFPFAVAVFIMSGIIILKTKPGRWMWFSTLAALAVFVVWNVARTDRRVAETCRAQGYSSAGGGWNSVQCVDGSGRVVILPEY
jgi:hypothetical protein